MTWVIAAGAADEQPSYTVQILVGSVAQARHSPKMRGIEERRLRNGG
jgi:hypothetical protein